MDSESKKVIDCNCKNSKHLALEDWVNMIDTVVMKHSNMKRQHARCRVNVLQRCGAI